LTKYLKSLGAALAGMIAAAGLPAPITARLDAAQKDRKSPLPVVVRFATILREAEAKCPKGLRGNAQRNRIRAARAQAVTAAAGLGYVA
jgi:hypothetical protein